MDAAGSIAAVVERSLQRAVQSKAEGEPPDSILTATPPHGAVSFELEGSLLAARTQLYHRAKL